MNPGHLTRRAFLGGLGGLGAAALLGTQVSCRRQPRNLLLITTDTLRLDHVGAFGGRVRTPHLDALARRGVACDDAWTASSWTLPSHVSLMTSLPPRAHGVNDSATRLGAGAVTLAAVLARAGWRTAAIVSNLYCSRRYGLEAGFAEFADARARRTANTPGNLLTDQAIAWLGDAAVVRAPFFLWLHYYDAHWPYLPPSPYDSMYGSTEAPTLALFNRLRAAPPGELEALQQRPQSLGFGAGDFERARQLYAGEVSFMDAQIGRVLAQLAASGLESRTVVAVASDHGEHFGEHGRWFAHHLPLSAALLRNPLILAAPERLPRGTRSAATVEMIDIAPTLLTLLGEPAAPEFRGRDLSRPLAGDSPPEKRPAIAEHPSPTPGDESSAAAADGYLYVEEAGGGRLEALAASTPPFSDARERARVERRMARALDEHRERFRPPASRQELELNEEEKRRLRSLGYLV